MEKIEYIVMDWKSKPRSKNNVVKFSCVSAVVINKNTGMYLALEFIREEFGLVGWRLEDGESPNLAIIREIEEETWYKNWKILDILIDKIYSRWYKARKDREEEALDMVFLVEVEEQYLSEVLWADVGTEKIHWFDKNEMSNKLTLTHHKYFFKKYLDKYFFSTK